MKTLDQKIQAKYLLFIYATSNKDRRMHFNSMLKLINSRPQEEIERLETERMERIRVGE